MHTHTHTQTGKEACFRHTLTHTHRLGRRRALDTHAHKEAGKKACFRHTHTHTGI